MGLFDLERWEKYKQGLPASITEGPIDPNSITMEPDSTGTKIFHGAMDTLDALRGDPASSREGLGRSGIWDNTVGVAGDVSAIAQGKMMPIQTEPIVGEPSTYEKIMSPIADISSILHGRGLPSRKAALARDKLQLEEEEQDFAELNSFLETNHKAITRSRDLPPEQQVKSLHTLADLLEERLGPGAGAFLNQEADFAGSTPDDMKHLFEASPAAEAVYRTGGRSALQDFLRDQGNMDDITAALDAQALGTVNQLWGEVLEPWMSEHESATMERLQKGGLDMGEVGEILNLVPESMVPQSVRPELMGWLERNAGKVGFLDSEAVTEKYNQKRAELRAKSASTLAGEQSQWSPKFTDDAGRWWQTNYVTGETKKLAEPVTKTAKVQGLYEVTLADGTRGDNVFQFNDGSFKDDLGNVVHIPSGAKLNKIGTMKAADAKSLRASVGRLGGTLASLVNLRSQVKPGVAGFRRIGGKAAGGIAELLLGEKAGAGVAEFVSGFPLEEGAGATQAEITKFAQDAQDLSTDMIAIFSGDKSTSRLSDQDRKRGEQYANLINASSSPTQIEAATRNLMGLMLKNDMAERIEEGLAPAWDMTTEEGGREFFRFATQELHVDASTANKWMKEIVSQQRISRALAGEQ